jgi:hypothetical protein
MRIMKSKIPEICEIKQSVFEEAAERAAYELLERAATDFGNLESILPLMNEKRSKIYN